MLLPRSLTRGVNDCFHHSLIFLAESLAEKTWKFDPSMIMFQSCRPRFPVSRLTNNLLGEKGKYSKYKLYLSVIYINESTSFEWKHSYNVKTQKLAKLGHKNVELESHNRWKQGQAVAVCGNSEWNSSFSQWLCFSNAHMQLDLILHHNWARRSNCTAVIFCLQINEKNFR